MIIWSSGNLFDSGADILVDLNNSVGVSGAGLAKQFKEKFPLAYKSYRDHCLNGVVLAGEAYLNTEGFNPMVINMITKRHWKDPSKIEWIDSGLGDVVKILKRLNLAAQENNDPKRLSLGIGRPGCGYGGLDWLSQVKPLVIKYLDPLPNTIFVY